jgi:hypothetical protein
MSEMAAKGKPQLATGPQKLVPDALICGFASEEVERRIPGRAGTSSRKEKEERKWSAPCAGKVHDA